MSTLLGKLGEAKTNYYKAFGQNKIAKNAYKNILGKKVQNMVVNIGSNIFLCSQPICIHWNPQPPQKNKNVIFSDLKIGPGALKLPLNLNYFL